MLSTKVAAILLATAMLNGCSNSPYRPGGADDSAALRQVVEAFRTSIINKDKPAFMRLFFSDKPAEITWQAVVDDQSLATIRLKNPQANKARHRPDNNFDWSAGRSPTLNAPSSNPLNTAFIV
jgi:hypothetical protein